MNKKNVNNPSHSDGIKKNYLKNSIKSALAYGLFFSSLACISWFILRYADSLSFANAGACWFKSFLFVPMIVSSLVTGGKFIVEVSCTIHNHIFWLSVSLITLSTFIIYGFVGFLLGLLYEKLRYTKFLFLYYFCIPVILFVFLSISSIIVMLSLST